MGQETGLDWPIWFAIINAGVMIIAGLSVFFFHDRKYADIERMVDYSFSSNVFSRVAVYYRGLGALMLFFFLVFSLSLFLLQRTSEIVLFQEGEATLLGMMLFAFDLVARGAFFDWMEHFRLRLTPLHMNREYLWFVIYAFVFRMFYALTLLRILISFAWIYRKILVAKRGRGPDEPII